VSGKEKLIGIIDLGVPTAQELNENLQAIVNEKSEN